MEQQFVRVDCDFDADGLWTKRGAALSPEDLGLSPGLCVALRAWQLHYDETATVVSGNSFNYVAHERIGRELAALVRSERPDLHVVYGGDEPYPGESSPSS
jgi:hypothetical protein